MSTGILVGGVPRGVSLDVSGSSGRARMDSTVIASDAPGMKCGISH